MAQSCLKDLEASAVRAESHTKKKAEMTSDLKAGFGDPVKVTEDGETVEKWPCELCMYIKFSPSPHMR
jgi:hypothetical protein